MEASEPAALRATASPGPEQRARVRDTRVTSGLRPTAAVSNLHALPPVRIFKYLKAIDLS